MLMFSLQGIGDTLYSAMQLFLLSEPRLSWHCVRQIQYFNGVWSFTGIFYGSAWQVVPKTAVNLSIIIQTEAERRRRDAGVL